MESRDIFLSSDERYDIWEVKRVERPELLFAAEEDDWTGEEEKKDASPPPLNFTNGVLAPEEGRIRATSTGRLLASAASRRKRHAAGTTIAAKLNMRWFDFEFRD